MGITCSINVQKYFFKTSPGRARPLAVNIGVTGGSRAGGSKRGQESNYFAEMKLRVLRKSRFRSIFRLADDAAAKRKVSKLKMNN